MKIAIGYDPNAVEYADIARRVSEELGCEIVTFIGDNPIYAETAIRVANDVVSGKADRGVLFCGTGIGMSIAANKVRGAYAALISDVYSAVRAEKSNRANIACFGAFTIGEKLMSDLLKVWLTTEYRDGTPSAQKIERICEYEEETHAGTDVR